MCSLPLTLPSCCATRPASRPRWPPGMCVSERGWASVRAQRLAFRSWAAHLRAQSIKTVWPKFSHGLAASSPPLTAQHAHADSSGRLLPPWRIPSFCLEPCSSHNWQFCLPLWPGIARAQTSGTSEDVDEGLQDGVSVYTKHSHMGNNLHFQCPCSNTLSIILSSSTPGGPPHGALSFSRLTC